MAVVVDDVVVPVVVEDAAAADAVADDGDGDVDTAGRVVDDVVAAVDTAVFQWVKTRSTCQRLRSRKEMRNQVCPRRGVTRTG